MKNDSETSKRDPDMLDEYDFSGGVRGKYAHLHSKQSTIQVKISSASTPTEQLEESTQSEDNN